MFTASILVHLHNDPFVIWRTWMSKLGPNLALWQFFWKNGHPKLWFWGVFLGLRYCLCVTPNPLGSLYSNCLSGAKASDIKLWLSLVRLKKLSLWILIGNQMLSWSTTHQCIIAYSQFSLDEIVLPQVCFCLNSMYLRRLFICID